MATIALIRKAGAVCAGSTALYGVYWGIDRYILNGVPPSPPIHTYKSREVYRRPCETLLGYEVVVKQHWLEDSCTSSSSSSTVREEPSPEQQQHEPTAADKMFAQIKKTAKFMLSWDEDSGRGQRRGDENVDNSDHVMIQRKPVKDDSVGERTDLYASLTLRPRTSDGSLSNWMDTMTQQSLQKCSADVIDGYSDASTCLPDPNYLPSPYLRVMLGCLALLHAPLPCNLRVATIGVAGGALPMFLQTHFGPNISQLDLVDIEPVCFDAATKKMGLRQLSEVNMRFIAEDGLAFLQSVNDLAHPKYDVIFIDAFIGSDVPKHISDSEFLVTARKALKTTGVLAMNMPGDDYAFLAQFKLAFGSNNVFTVKAPNSANRVIIATRNSPMHGVQRIHIVRRARQLSVEHNLPFDISTHFPITWSAW